MSIAEVLEREHRATDDGIETFANANGDHTDATADHRAALLAAVAVLRRHIYLEEEYLFPPLRQAGLAGPVMVMVHEHGQMWPILDQLEQTLTTGTTDTASLLCRGLLALLATHNTKEERILYPQADELLPAGDRVDLGDLITTVQIPPGWVCHSAGKAGHSVR